MDSAFRNSEIWVRYSGGQLGQAEMSLSTPTDVLSLDCQCQPCIEIRRNSGRLLDEDDERERDVPQIFFGRSMS